MFDAIDGMEETERLLLESNADGMSSAGVILIYWFI